MNQNYVVDIVQKKLNKSLGRRRDIVLKQVNAIKLFLEIIMVLSLLDQLLLHKGRHMVQIELCYYKCFNGQQIVYNRYTKNLEN